MGKYFEFLIEKNRENNTFVGAMFRLTRTDILAFVMYYILIQNIISFGFMNLLFVISIGNIIFDFIIFALTVGIMFFVRPNYLENLKYLGYAALMFFFILGTITVIAGIAASPPEPVNPQFAFPGAIEDSEEIVIIGTGEDGMPTIFGFNIFVFAFFMLILSYVFNTRMFRGF